MLMNHLILTVLWILYCLLHSILADSGFKENMAALMGKNFKFYRVLYTLFAFISLVALLLFQLSIESAFLFQRSAPALFTGLFLGSIGLAIMAVCIRKYFFSLSGLKGLVEESSTGQLMTNGLHQYMRHPLYSGTFAFIWGGFLLFPKYSLLIANTIITIYTLIGISLEEKKLISEFGKQYIQYRQKVPMLFPLKPKQKF
jgi:methanethiol S-methyltransferase